MACMQEQLDVNKTLSSSPSNGFITVDIQESDEEVEDVKKEGKQKRTKETKISRADSGDISSNKDITAVESLISNNNAMSPQVQPLNTDLPQHGSSSTSPPQELPPSDLSPTAFLDNLEVIVSSHTIPAQVTSHSSIAFHNVKPSMSSSIFSFIMTVAFVCILWLVVFMVFGYRGHTIAGVFVGLFFIGLLINTCFLKLYFRLKVFLGISAALAAADRQTAAIQRHRQLQEKRAAEKASEKPPSYASAMASPPPYNLLQYYKQKRSTVSVNSSASRTSMYRKGHNCPFCKREVKIFGICISCKNNLSRK